MSARESTATPQRLQSNDTLTLGDGDFSGIEGLASRIALTDGFEISSGELGHLVP